MIILRTISGNFPVWKRTLLQATGAAFLLLAFGGCSSLSKTASKRPSSSSEPMLVAASSTTFQPLQSLQTPIYQGLQTSLATVRRQTRSAAAPRQLPQFTPVKVLKINKSYALVELQSGERGFLPLNSIATESSLVAGIPAALPVDPNAPYLDPVTGQMINPLLPAEMITTDPLVDQAMLNEVDSVHLPESEAEFKEMNPEAQVVDDVLLRKPAPTPSPTPKVAGG